MMREDQKKQPLPEGDRYRVNCPVTDPEIKKVTEALNLFYRFLSGENRDNFLQVHSIEEVK